MSDPAKQKLGPKDPRNFVYLIFYWLGIGTLLPWNFFISVSEYWKYKWRTVDFELTTASNDTVLADADADLATNEMQTRWQPLLSVASMVPNVTFLLLNAIVGHRFRTQPRLLVSLCLVILLFIFTMIMTKVNTDGWQGVFFNLTLLSVALININAAIFQGGLLGIAGKFPPRYIGGVFSGQALGGIFASGTNIIFLALGADVVYAAFFSFLIAVLFLGTSLIGYIAVTKSEFFQFYVDEVPGVRRRKYEVEEAKFLPGDKDQGVSVPTKVNPLRVAMKIFPYAVSVFLIFLVTLGCFPGITVLIVSTGQGSGSAWSDRYFVPVVCFLLFNIGDYVGRTVAELVKWPKPDRTGTIIAVSLSALRLVFVPLFLFCNANPHNRYYTDVLFANDIVYIVLIILFSTSNGYLASVCMMSAPQICLPEDQQTAASLMVAFLGIGLGVGAALSNVLVLFL